VASAAYNGLTDDQLLEGVQQVTFQYFWDFAHPVSGLTREGYTHAPDICTTGGTGMGLMAVVVGANRGFVTRAQAADRVLQMLTFLDESATQAQMLGRASLIAHETAHMWFGDLVTMNWFDDVWTKEVFANFMAAKIVHPSFPEVDHELRFLLAHHPTAYGVDRTEGANPIRQALPNLREAGTLYGAIIYQKAPVIMRQLELLVGEDPFRDGMREYLQTFAFGNATWPALVEILDRNSPEDLRAWSDVWVEEPGRPTVWAELQPGGDGTVASLTLRQADPAGEGRVWAWRS